MGHSALVEAEHITAFPTANRTSFYYSFSFLPKEEREAIHTVYAFCRQIDDIVDDNPTRENEIILKKRRRLDWWRNEIERSYADGSTILLPLTTVNKRFSIPKQYFLTLIDGCERDLLQYRYETFADLKEYCYAVASVVGLMCIEIFGYKYDETQEYAINLGYALQLTNILRDIKTDKDRGYIYLPQEDLQRFKLANEDIFNERYDERFIELMRFEARRIREYYHKARTALRPDERNTMFTAEIMDAIYYRLLEKIELNDFNVFRKKIKVSTSHKIIIALKHYLSSRMFISRIKK
ncbi:MAG TPA: presqualene diphosphate synthase HpnD [Candidatus Kapabacteria bacterium]|jgi:phytoene synthase|nr:presqualene diphosphate synthase HpnD [Ignavibacteria bacterium]HRI30577.1 presqualene diphosphate synthase HpnD [Candidatus Kapabacteria bacterium]HRK59383.1 presqualene diphosphate synthase HpnD [Candidatus Kapabacteria bacterium]